MTDIVIKDIAEQEAVRLETQNNSAVMRANGIAVTSDAEYTAAAEFLKSVKLGIRAVESTFSDMKSQANKAHKAVCDKENSFKKPLLEAETIVKKKMQIYYTEQERIRREEEARLREEQRRLADEQLKRAAELEAEGKNEQAEAALHTASIIDNLNTVMDISAPKTEGISTQADYEIRIINESLVPAYVSGIEIRKIDLAAIKKLAKMTAGKLEIPGVMIVPTKTIKVRAI